MQSVTAIEPSWLHSVGTPLLGSTKIAENPPPNYDEKGIG